MLTTPAPELMRMPPPPKVKIFGLPEVLAIVVVPVLLNTNPWSCWATLKFAVMLLLFTEVLKLAFCVKPTGAVPGAPPVPLEFNVQLAVSVKLPVPLRFQYAVSAKAEGATNRASAVAEASSGRRRHFIFMGLTEMADG